jgi:origin recognition complex subunit 3
LTSSVLSFIPHFSFLISLVTQGGENEGDGNVDGVEEQGQELWNLPDTSILFHRYLESGKMMNVYDWYESFYDALEMQRRESAKARKREENQKLKLKLKAREKEKKASTSATTTPRRNSSPKKNRGGSRSLSPRKKGKAQNTRDAEDVDLDAEIETKGMRADEGGGAYDKIKDTAKGTGRNTGKDKATEDEDTEKEIEPEPEPEFESEEKWNLMVQARFMRALHELDYLGFIKHTGRKADHVLRTVFEVVES